MKIGIDITQAVAVGGVSTYVRELVTQLLLLDNTHKYKLIVNASFPYSFKKHGLVRESTAQWEQKWIPFPRSLLSRLWCPGSFLPLEYFIGNFKIFHAPSFLLPPLRTGRGVLTVHDCTFLKFPHYFYCRDFSKWEYNSILPASLKRAEIVIVDSKATQRDILEYFSISEDRVRVVPLGVSEDFFMPAAGELRKSPLYSFNIDKPFILYVVGTPEPRKNFKNLLKGYSQFINRGYQGVPLVLTVDRNSAVQLIEDAVPETFLQSYVHFLGNVSRSALIELLQKCHIFVYPSLYEGFGLPVLEAMGAGAAIIAGNRGAVPEVLGDAGVLVDPEQPDVIKDAFVALMDSEEKRQSFKLAAGKRAKLFSWEETAKKTVAIYEEIGNS